MGESEVDLFRRTNPGGRGARPVCMRVQAKNVHYTVDSGAGVEPCALS